MAKKQVVGESGFLQMQENEVISLQPHRLVQTDPCTVLLYTSWQQECSPNNRSQKTSAFGTLWQPKGLLFSET